MVKLFFLCFRLRFLLSTSREAVGIITYFSHSFWAETSSGGRRKNDTIIKTLDLEKNILEKQIVIEFWRKPACDFLEIDYKSTTEDLTFLTLKILLESNPARCWVYGNTQHLAALRKRSITRWFSLKVLWSWVAH